MPASPKKSVFRWIVSWQLRGLPELSIGGARRICGDCGSSFKVLTSLRCAVREPAAPSSLPTTLTAVI